MEKNKKSKKDKCLKPFQGDCIIYKDKRGGWRSKLVASNGRVIQVSSEAYRNFKDLLEMVIRIYGGNPFIGVVVPKRFWINEIYRKYSSKIRGYYFSYGEGCPYYGEEWMKRNKI